MAFSIFYCVFLFCKLPLNCNKLIILPRIDVFTAGLFSTFSAVRACV